MTVETTDNRTSDNGNGVTVAFPFPDYFLADTDLIVYVGGVLQTLTTDYSVVGAGNSNGGTVTFLVAPPVGVGNVVIIRQVDLLQQTALPSNGPFPSSSVERMVDKCVLASQRLYDLITRSLRLSDSDPASVSTQLPVTAGNGGNVLRMNVAETALEYVDPGSVALAIPADGSVTTAKIVNGNVTAAKLAAGAALGNIGAQGVLAQYLADSALDFTGMRNGTIVTSRAGNAETIAIKTKAGADPTAGDPVLFVFRNAVAGTGDYTVLRVTAALSIVIPSGATLGAANGVPFRIWLIAFNDGGTLRLGVVKTVSGTSVMALKDDDLNSSTLTPANNAQVIYTTGAGVATKAMRLLGYLEYTLAAVGTWITPPSKNELFGPGVPVPGQTFQPQRADTGAVATGTTPTPFDDTIPQITEGDQYMSQAITPSSSANLLCVKSELQVYSTAAGNWAVVSAIFQDATANALKASYSTFTAGYVGRISVSHSMLAATVATTTFKVRAGITAAGTTTFNGASGARAMGGVSNSYIEVTETMT